MKPTPTVSMLVGVLVSLVSVFGATAHAEPASSALSWVRLPGAEPCISTTELGARIERHLGRAVLVSPSVADISIEGRIAPSGRGAATRYKATVGGARKDGTAIGSRELTSSTADCRSLDDDLVLVVALMIDPNAFEPPRAEPTPMAPPGPVVTREIIHERLVVREVESPAPTTSHWSIQGTLLGLVAAERLPGAAPGIGVAVRAGPSRRLGIELSLGLVPDATLDVEPRSVAFTLFDGGVALCPAAGLGTRIDAAFCAGMRGGVIRSRGRGFPTDSDVDRGLADVAAGPRVSVTLAGPLFAVASLTALVPLVRQETSVTRANGERVVLHERSLLGAEAGIGLGMHFSP